AGASGARSEAKGSGSSSTGTPPRVQIPSLSAKLSSRNCFTPVKQCRPYIQRFAEWPLAGKPERMRRLAALLAIAALALGPAACRKQPQGAVKVIVIGAAPELRDPTLGPMSEPDQVLLANAAQGLVGF